MQLMCASLKRFLKRITKKVPKTSSEAAVRKSEKKKLNERFKFHWHRGNGEYLDNDEKRSNLIFSSRPSNGKRLKQ